VAPLLSVADDPAAPWVQAARLVEIEVDSQDALAPALVMAEQVQTANPRAVVGLRLPLASGSLGQVEQVVAAGIGMVHLAADETGYELSGDPPRFLTDLLQEAHHRLVAAGLRDQVTLVVSGGIAAAEHVPKALCLRGRRRGSGPGPDGRSGLCLVG